MMHKLSCLEARGIFLYQGLNLCLLLWQVDTSLLSHQGSPKITFLIVTFTQWLPNLLVFFRVSLYAGKKLYVNFSVFLFLVIFKVQTFD